MTDQSPALVRFLDTTRLDRQFHPYRRPPGCDKFSEERQRLMTLVLSSLIHNEAKVPYVTLFPEEWSARQPECRILFGDSLHYKIIVRRDRRYHPYRRPRKYFRRRRRHSVPFYHDYGYFSSAVRKNLEMKTTNEDLADTSLKITAVPEVETKEPVRENLDDTGIKSLTECDNKQMRERETECGTSNTDHCSTSQSITDTEVHTQLPIPDISNTTQINQEAEKDESDGCRSTTSDTSHFNNGAAAQTAHLPEPASAITTECESEQTEVEKDTEVVPRPGNADNDQPDFDENLSQSSSSSRQSVCTTENGDVEMSLDLLAPLESDVTAAQISANGEHDGGNLPLRKIDVDVTSDVDGSSNNTKRPQLMSINPTMVSQFEAMVNHGFQRHEMIDIQENREPARLTGKHRSRRTRKTCPYSEARSQTGTRPDPTGSTPADREPMLPDKDPIMARLAMIKAECLQTKPENQTVKIQSTDQTVFKPSLSGQTARCNFPTKDKYSWTSRDTGMSIKRASQQDRLDLRKKRFGEILDQPKPPQFSGKSKFVFKKIQF